MKKQDSLQLSAYLIIDKKKKKQILSKEEINFFIEEMVKGTIHDYQVTAFLMACFLNGLNEKETYYLTHGMLNSGFQFPVFDKKTIDKHSTGGVGDKTSFILGPIAAAAGVKVPMIAGRGLGHTGGTVDKIEAIEGFKTQLTLKEFSELLMKYGLVLIGQTGEIAPADKKIYALRDVTATIDNVSLITASIMSKKLAEGASGYVFDIKVGNGAFMKTLSQATELAKSMNKMAKLSKRKAISFITDMNQPLGNTFGHSLELIECFEILKGKGDKRLTSLSVDLAAAMIQLAGLATNFAKARKIALEKIADGSALKELENLIERQGGNPKVVSNYELLPMAKTQTVIKAKKSGYVAGWETEKLGLWLIQLGGGRVQSNAPIDFSVGVYCHAFVGDKLTKGQEILTIYHHDHQLEKVNIFKDKLEKEFLTISSKKVKALPLVYKTIK